MYVCVCVYIYIYMKICTDIKLKFHSFRNVNYKLYNYKSGTLCVCVCVRTCTQPETSDVVTLCSPCAVFPMQVFFKTSSFCSTGKCWLMITGVLIIIGRSEI
jgi:hypothetical protein